MSRGIFGVFEKTSERKWVTWGMLGMALHACWLLVSAREGGPARKGPENQSRSTEIRVGTPAMNRPGITLTEKPRGLLSATWRSQRDPWLCVPPLRMVCPDRESAADRQGNAKCARSVLRGSGRGRLQASSHTTIGRKTAGVKPGLKMPGSGIGLCLTQRLEWIGRTPIRCSADLRSPPFLLVPKRGMVCKLSSWFRLMNPPWPTGNAH